MHFLLSNYFSIPVAGTDYVNQTYTVTFPAGETTQTITVMTLEDSLREGTEVFSATLSNPVGDDFSIGATSTATVKIEDDDGTCFTLMWITLLSNVLFCFGESRVTNFPLLVDTLYLLSLV